MKLTGLAIVLICLLAVAIPAQVDLFAPTPVPFTPDPGGIEWRIGFDLGNIAVLETPELNPQRDFNLAVREADRNLGEPPLSFGLGLLRFPKILTQSEQLLNPRQWTVVDLKGQVKRASFRAIGVFMGTMMVAEQGGYHLVSVDPMPSNPFIGFRREPASDDLIFALAGPLKRKPEVRPRLSETRWKNLKPVEDPENLPSDFLAAKRMLGVSRDPGVLFGTSIEVLIRNVPERLWLLNFGTGDTKTGRHPWGIFKNDDEGSLQPLYVFKPGSSDYVAWLDAAIDLDQDGTDELIVEEDYRDGTAFQVLSLSGKSYEKIYRTYFRGRH